MTVYDRGLSIQEVDALSTSLEIDLENCFRAIQAHVMWILINFSPQQALVEIERIFGSSITDYMSVEEEIDAPSGVVVE